MKGLWIGLLLGFALGAGVVYVAVPGLGGDPSPPRKPEPGSGSGSGAGGGLIPGPGPPPGVTSRGDDSAPSGALAPSKAERAGAWKKGVFVGPNHTWTGPDLLAGLEGLLAGRPAPAGWTAKNLGLCISGEIYKRGQGRAGYRVPRSLVERLLDAEDPSLRVLGAGLTALAEPTMLDRIRELVLDDPDPQVRGAAVGWINMLAVEHEETVLDLVLAASRDSSRRVRLTAVYVLGPLANNRSALADWLVAATRDEDPDVRQVAIDHLENAGTLGADRAVQLLFEAGYDPETIRPLAAAIVRGGRLAEVLDRKPSPEIVTVLLSVCDYQDDEVEEEVARHLAGRFEELLPLYQPEDDEAYAEFFRLAVMAGDAAFLRKVVLSASQPQVVRLAALEAGLLNESTARSSLTAARTVFEDKKTSPRFRVRVLESVAACLWTDSGIQAPSRELLKEVARSDESPWVREAAREALGD